MPDKELKKIQAELAQIKTRNLRVEADKAWETSWFRKITIVLMTYAIAVIVMYVIKVDNPWTGALIPTVGFYLSTASLPFIKKWWIKRHQKK